MVRSLRELATRLVRSNPDVAAVVLFGSLARGDYGLRSDADLLVCLRAERADRPADRIPPFLAAFLGALVPVDVFPLTEQLSDFGRYVNQVPRRAALSLLL